MSAGWEDIMAIYNPKVNVYHNDYNYDYKNKMNELMEELAKHSKPYTTEEDEIEEVEKIEKKANKTEKKPGDDRRIEEIQIRSS